MNPSLSKGMLSLLLDSQQLSSRSDEDTGEMLGNSEGSEQREIGKLMRELRNGTGSYACSEGLRRIQEKKEGMERLFQLLEIRVQALERAERQVKTQLLSIKQREAALNSAKPTPHSASIDATRSLLELQRTAELLEAKTRKLIVKDRELECKVMLT